MNAYPSSLPLCLWSGATRGLLVGLLGGLAAGGVEATSVLRDAPMQRASLAEAALYAVLVNALLCAGAAAALGLLTSVAIWLLRSHVSQPQATAFQVVASTTVVLVISGVSWTLQAARSARQDPTAEIALVVALALLAGIALFPLARGFAPSLLAPTRRVAVLGITGALALALVFPFQVATEAIQQVSLSSQSSAGAHALDMTLIEAVDSPIDLESRLADLARHKAPQNIQPNVLLITVDALRADHLGACGNRWIKTPSLDLLASYSIVSCNAYTQQPQTNPALASLLTSTYPSVHGVRMHMVDRLPDSFDTLAEILKRVGFTTAAVIPWTSLEPAFSGFHQGFDTYEAFVVNEPEVLRNPATAALAGVYRRVTDQLAVGSAVESVLGLRQGTEAEIDGRADVTAAASASWLSANAQSRFFLWVHYFDPHYPWTPPEPWDRLYDQSYDGPFDGSMQFIYEMREGVFRPDARDVQFLRAMYASEVSYADHYIGRMLGQMARMGLLDNTIIVLTADHGESLGERGTSWPDGEYWLHGDDLYDPGVQIPFMVFDPRVATHQPLREPIQQIDVMPTILDLLRMPIPSQAQGKSIVPLAAGAESGVDRVAVSVLGNDSTTSIVSADGWKLVATRGGAPELYNLNTDPYERTNLVTSAPARALELAQRLDAVVQGNQQRISRAVADERPRG